MAKGEDLHRVGRAVAARRGQLGMTQQELADSAHVDLKTIYNLESGTRWPIARTRGAIAAALQWEADALAAMASEPGPPGREPHRLPGVPEFTPEIEEAIQPYLPDIRIAIEAARRLHPGEPLDGKKIFPRKPADRDSWDRLDPGGRYPPEVVGKWLAAVQFWADELAQDQGNGTAAGLPALDDRGPWPPRLHSGNDAQERGENGCAGGRERINCKDVPRAAGEPRGTREPAV